MASLKLPAWAVAITAIPQRAASARTAASLGSPISSTATQSGAMERISAGTAMCRGAPSITSVRGPTSSVGTPSTQAASSCRSSAMATHQPSSEIRRARSRRQVVLPMPGREISSVEWSLPPPSISGYSSAAQPGTARATRRQAAPMPDSPATLPPSIDTWPHTPTRQPSGRVKKPCLSSSSRA